jgi:hypothetical protein
MRFGLTFINEALFVSDIIAILAKVGFVKDETDSQYVAEKLNEYNHKVNTQVYYFKEKVMVTLA